jgi:hypothetical protein
MSVLKSKVGWHWLSIVVKALRKKNSILKNSHWKEGKTPEERFVQRLSLARAIYAQLEDMLSKDEAFETMREIIVPIGTQ